MNRKTQKNGSVTITFGDTTVCVRFDDYSRDCWHELAYAIVKAFDGLDVDAPHDRLLPHMVVSMIDLGRLNVDTDNMPYPNYAEWIGRMMNTAVRMDDAWHERDEQVSQRARIELARMQEQGLQI